MEMKNLVEFTLNSLFFARLKIWHTIYTNTCLYATLFCNEGDLKRRYSTNILIKFPFVEIDSHAENTIFIKSTNKFFSPKIVLK